MNTFKICKQNETFTRESENEGTYRKLLGKYSRSRKTITKNTLYTEIVAQLKHYSHSPSHLPNKNAAQRTPIDERPYIFCIFLLLFLFAAGKRIHRLPI